MTPVAEMPPLHVVAAVIAEPRGAATNAVRVLVQQRHAGGPRGLTWEFPGGKVEPGETEPVALARECAEELGAAVRVGPLLWRVVHPYPDRAIALAVYAAAWPAGAPAPRALAARKVAWVALGDLPALPFCPADGPLVAALAEGAMVLPAVA